MKRLVMVALICTTVFPAYAAVYEWVDDAGVINFTDNLDKVPMRYRGKARVKDLSEEKNISIMKEEAVAPPADSGSSTGGTSYGGHDIAWWRSRMAAVREEIGTVADGLPEKRKQLLQLQHRRRVFQKAADRVAYNDLKKEIEADEAKVQELEQKLIRLEGEATAAGVPKER